MIRAAKSYRHLFPDTSRPSWCEVSGLFPRREAGFGVAEHGAVADAEGFDPALLAQGEADEKTQLDQFGIRKVLMQFRPQRVIGDV